MSPEEAMALLKRETPATEDEINQLKAYLQTDSMLVATPEFAKWLPINKALVMDMQRRQALIKSPEELRIEEAQRTERKRMTGHD